MKQQTNSGQFKNYITQLDGYGVPISMTYNNQVTFKTFIGGIMTIISRIAILAYFLYQFRDLANHKKVITKKTNILNLAEDNSTYFLNSSNFDIAL